MCPACISMATWLVVGGLSGGGALTVGINVWRQFGNNVKPINDKPLR